MPQLCPPPKKKKQGPWKGFCSLPPSSLCWVSVALDLSCCMGFKSQSTVSLTCCLGQQPHSVSRGRYLAMLLPFAPCKRQKGSCFCMLCCACPLLDMAQPPGAWMAVDRKVWAPERPSCLHTLPGPAALCPGFPRLQAALGGAREPGQHVPPRVELRGRCSLLLAAFLREQGLPVWPRRASLA